MDSINYINEALVRIERIMRASMKAHEGLTELRTELVDGKSELPRTEKVPVMDLSVLSERQRAIFDLIAMDMPNAEIARKLHLSKRTVESHRNTIRRELKFSTAAELKQFANAHKITPGHPGRPTP